MHCDILIERISWWKTKYYSRKGNSKNHFLPSYFEVIPLKYVSDTMKRRALCKVIPSRHVLSTLLPCRFLSSCCIYFGGESRLPHFNGRVFVRLVKEAISINGSWFQGHCCGHSIICSFQTQGLFRTCFSTHSKSIQFKMIWITAIQITLMIKV